MAHVKGEGGRWGGIGTEALQSLSRRTCHLLHNQTCRDCRRDAREVQSPGSKHKLKAGTACFIQQNL